MDGLFSEISRGEAIALTYLSARTLNGEGSNESFGGRGVLSLTTALSDLRHTDPPLIGSNQRQRPISVHPYPPIDTPSLSGDSDAGPDRRFSRYAFHRKPRVTAVTTADRDCRDDASDTVC